MSRRRFVFVFNHGCVADAVDSKAAAGTIFPARDPGALSVIALLSNNNDNNVQNSNP